MAKSRKKQRMQATDGADKAFLAYLFSFISGLYILIRYRKSRFARYCGWQSILLSVFFIAILFLSDLALHLLLPVVGAGITTMSNIAAIIGGIIYFILWAGMVTLSITCMYYAFYLEVFHIPVLGSLALKLAGREKAAPRKKAAPVTQEEYNDDFYYYGNPEDDDDYYYQTEDDNTGR